MNRNGRELEEVIHTVQHIVPEWLAQEGLELKLVWYSMVFTSVSVGSNPGWPTYSLPLWFEYLFTLP